MVYCISYLNDDSGILEEEKKITKLKKKKRKKNYQNINKLTVEVKKY